MNGSFLGVSEALQVSPEVDLPGESGPKWGELVPKSPLTGAKVAPIDRKQPKERIVIRCTPEFASWCAGLADHLGISVSLAVECGLARLSDHHVYRDPIPRRWQSIRSKLRERRRPTDREVSPDALPTA